jgi:hypothetical protein
MIKDSYNTFKQKAIHIGDMSLKKYNQGLVFNASAKFKRNHSNNNKKIISLGDVVYALEVDGEPMKYGKAGGKNGYIGRMTSYRTIKDKTTKKIVNDIKETGSTIKVFVVPSPKKIVKITCPVTKEKISSELETAIVNEQRFIQAAYKDGYKLPWCTEIKK